MARILVPGVLAALLAASCIEEAPYPPNLPPDTQIYIRADTLSAANYRTILHWSGTDIDGYIRGFAYQWNGPWSPESDDSLWWEDPTWAFTAATTDTFDVPIGGEYADRTFSVRAIDDGGLADPSPVSQWFRLTNAIPSVEWTDTSRHPTPARPSLPAVSFAWTPQDFDGRETIAFARLWLDTAEGEDSVASAITVVRDTVGAFFPEHFQGRLGERTVYCQVWDRAATPSNIISWSWNVIAPTGEYLVIDNAGERTIDDPQSIQDSFWRARAEALFPGNYHVYDVLREGPFRSAQEILPIFTLFQGVLWYGGWSYTEGEDSDEQLQIGLGLAEPAMVDYVRGGGRFFVSAHNAIGTGGGLSRSFWQEVFGIDEIYRRYVDEAWVTDMDLPRRSISGGGVYLRCSPHFGGADSLRVLVPVSKTDFFAPGPSVEPLLWLDPAVIDTTRIPEHATQPVYIGGQGSWGEGRMVLVSTLLTRLSSSGPVSVETAIEDLLGDLFDLR